MLVCEADDQTILDWICKLRRAVLADAEQPKPIDRMRREGERYRAEQEVIGFGPRE
jgi:hypothetical protein